MNWKRGLTRIYLVIWAVAALVGILITWGESDSAFQPRRQLKEFLARNAGVMSLEDLRTKSAEELEARIRAHAARPPANSFRPSESRGFTPDRPTRITLYHPETGEPTTFDPAEYDTSAMLKDGYSRTPPRATARGLTRNPMATDSFRPDLQSDPPDLVTDYSGMSPLARAQSAALHDDAYRELAWVWAQWLLYCGAAPGILLALVSWIISGFKK